MRGVNNHACPNEAAAQSVRESESSFCAFLDHCPDGALVISQKDKQILLASSAACRMLGYTAAELERLAVNDICPNAVQHQIFASPAALPEEGQPCATAIRMVRKDASAIVADVSRSGIELNGQPCFFISFRDVTEREQIQKRDRIQHTLMQALASTSRLAEGLNLCLDAAIKTDGQDSGGMYLLNKENNALELCAHRGVTREFAQATRQIRQGSPQFQLVAIGKPVYATYDELRRTQSEYKSKEGLLSVAIIPILHQGRLLGCLNAASHIESSISPSARMALETIAASATQAIVRLRAQEALRESELRFSTVFKTSPEAIGLTRLLDGRFFEINEAFSLLCEYTREELLDHTAEELQLWASPIRGEIASSIGNRSQMRGVEMQIRTKSGLIRHVLFSCEQTEFDGEPCSMAILTDIGEIKHAEAKLLESEHALHQVMEIGKIGAFEVDLSTGRSKWSDVVAELWGLPGDFAGDFQQYCWDHLHPQDLEWMKAFFDRFLLEGREQEIEFRIIHPDRSLRWLRWRGRVIRNESGEGVKIVGVNLDITGRKKAEETLAAEATRRRILVEGSRDGIVVLDQKGQVYEANRQFADMLGYSPAEAAHLHVWDWDCTWTREQLLNAIMRLGPSGDHFETRHRRKDGSQFDVEVSTNRAEMAGQILVFCVCRDITERKKATAALAEREEIFSSIVSQAMDAIALINVETGRFMEFNTAAHEGLGYTRDEFASFGIVNIQSEHSSEVIRRNVEQVLKQGGLAFETRHCHRNGTLRDVRVSARPLRIRDHDYVAAVWTDITERKRLESQLRQAQKLEAVGQLAGGVAHDFNNILAAIMIHLGLLEWRVQSDHETDQILKELKAEAQRAASLTRQLLMFSRRSVMEIKPLDLNEVVANMLKMLGRLISENIKLLFDACTGAPPCVAADIGMLEQVLMNLVVNARDALPRGGRITIATSLQSLNEKDIAQNTNRRVGCFVCLTVSDTGAGMDKATLAHIFEPFFTTKAPGKGTGLGLATVHGIIAQHKGWVEVESEPGKGATFRAFLPAAPDASGQISPGTPNAPLPLGCETILLVEDEAKVRQGTARILRTLGYCVHEAENGPQAIQLWHEKHLDADLLITDMVMPEEMTGLELASQLRLFKPELAVLISSGYSDDILHAGGIHHEGIRYLQKPFQIEALAETIRSCLGRKS